MFKILSTIILTLFCWAASLAQQNSEDVIFLKNGSIIRGKIITNTADTIKIESCGRNIFAFVPDDIMNIELNQPPIPQEKNTDLNYERKNGLYSYSTFGLLTGKSDVIETSGLSFRTNVGYEINQYAGIGFGSGVENYLTEMVPIFISLKSDVLKRQNTPFVNFHGGYSFPLDNEKVENYNTYKYSGGINAGFDIGICSYKLQNRAFSISAGYQYQRFVEKISISYWNSNSTETNTYDLNKIVIKIGFIFK